MMAARFYFWKLVVADFVYRPAPVFLICYCIILNTTILGKFPTSISAGWGIFYCLHKKMAEMWENIP